MTILAAILKRFGQMAILAALVASATFLLSSSIPGDFFSAQSLDLAARRQNLELLRRSSGLDQPLMARYLQWLERCARLDLGDSLFYRRPVRGVVLGALANTLWIGIPALAIGLLGGIFFGTLHGTRRGKPAAVALDVFSSAALGVPTLVLGMAALLIAARTAWFPLGSMNSVGAEDAGFLSWLFDRARHLVLPVACLAVPVLAYVEKVQCAATCELLGEAYVRAAHARGLMPHRIFMRHLVRPSLNPVLSTFGPLFASVLSGSLVLEVIFAWPGLGQVTYDGLFARDDLLVIGCVVGSTALLVLGNLSADFLVLILDPRTRARRGDL